MSRITIISIYGGCLFVKGYLVQDAQDRDRHGSLERPSRIRVDRIYTLAQSIVAKKFGQISEAAFDRIRQLLSELVVKKP